MNVSKILNSSKINLFFVAYGFQSLNLMFLSCYEFHNQLHKPAPVKKIVRSLIFLNFLTQSIIKSIEKIIRQRTQQGRQLPPLSPREHPNAYMYVFRRCAFFPALLYVNSRKLFLHYRVFTEILNSLIWVQHIDTLFHRYDKIYSAKTQIRPLTAPNGRNLYGTRSVYVSAWHGGVLNYSRARARVRVHTHTCICYATGI